MNETKDALNSAHREMYWAHTMRGGAGGGLLQPFLCSDSSRGQVFAE